MNSSKRTLGPAPEPKTHGAGPSPTPKARPDPDAMRELQQSTADLGFSRPSSPPERKPQASAPEPDRSAEAASPGGVLKCKVSGALFDELQLACVKRRTTVQFLLVEALQKAGYIHARNEQVSQDGRRQRARKR